MFNLFTKIKNFIKTRLAKFLYLEISKILGEKMYNTLTNSDYMRDDFNEL